MDSLVYKCLGDWARLVNGHKQEENVWSEMPAVPGFKFLNLKVLSVTIPEGQEVHDNEVSISFTYDKVESLVKEEVKTYSIIGVRKRNTDGTVDGFWVQDKIGTLTEAKERAKNYTESEKTEYVVVSGVTTTTPALQYFSNLKPIG